MALGSMVPSGHNIENNKKKNERTYDSIGWLSLAVLVLTVISCLQEPSSYFFLSVFATCTSFRALASGNSKETCDQTKSPSKHLGPFIAASPFAAWDTWSSFVSLYWSGQGELEDLKGFISSLKKKSASGWEKTSKTLFYGLFALGVLFTYPAGGLGQLAAIQSFAQSFILSMAFLLPSVAYYTLFLSPAITAGLGSMPTLVKKIKNDPAAFIFAFFPVMFFMLAFRITGFSALAVYGMDLLKKQHAFFGKIETFFTFMTGFSTGLVFLFYVMKLAIDFAFGSEEKLKLTINGNTDLVECTVPASLAKEIQTIENSSGNLSEHGQALDYSQVANKKYGALPEWADSHIKSKQETSNNTRSVMIGAFWFFMSLLFANIFMKGALSVEGATYSDFAGTLGSLFTTETNFTGIISLIIGIGAATADRCLSKKVFYPSNEGYLHRAEKYAEEFNKEKSENLKLSPTTLKAAWWISGVIPNVGAMLARTFGQDTFVDTTIDIKHKHGGAISGFFALMSLGLEPGPFAMSVIIPLFALSWICAAQLANREKANIGGTTAMLKAFVRIRNEMRQRFGNDNFHQAALSTLAAIIWTLLEPAFFALVGFLFKPILNLVDYCAPNRTFFFPKKGQDSNGLLGGPDQGGNTSVQMGSTIN